MRNEAPSSVRIRAAQPDDIHALRAIFREVTSAGETYVFDADMDDAAIADYWLGSAARSFVCTDDADQVLGMFKLVDNQRGRGAHVANASFMVGAQARGRGLGRRMGEACIAQARLAGYRAIQFNFVVASNSAAVHLWQSLGFRIVGTLPGAFHHARLGYVDAYVMFLQLHG